MLFSCGSSFYEEFPPKTITNEGFQALNYLNIKNKGLKWHHIFLAKNSETHVGNSNSTNFATEECPTHNSGLKN